MIFNDLCICCDCLLLLLHLFSVLPLFPSQKLKVNKLHNIVLSVVTGDHRKLPNQITAHHGEYGECGEIKIRMCHDVHLCNSNCAWF